MIHSRILAALFAAFMSTGTAQAHDLGDGGTHFHMAEAQGLATVFSVFSDHAWLVLAVAAALIVTGLALRRWKRG